MNYAIVFAGGVGKRMNNSTKPKQFLKIKDKPIIIHTLELFEKHDDIDGIILACNSEWIGYCKNLLIEFGIKKVLSIVEGGETALDSQYNALKKLAEIEGGKIEEDIVLIHDGVRPLITDKTISDCIESVKKHGSAITIARAIETIIRVNESGKIINSIEREECRLARAPQCFYLKDILFFHEKSIMEGKHEFIDSASMMEYYGRELYTVEGPQENIKVTTPSDYFSCEALLEAKGKKRDE